MARPAFDLVVGAFDAAGADVDLYYSTEARHLSTLGYAEGRLDQPILFADSMWPPLSTRGPRSVGHGTVTLANADGGLDSLLDYGFDNGAVQVRYVPDSSSGSFGGVVTGFGEQLVLDEGVATLYLRDPTYQLLKSAVPTRYAGSNTGSPLAGIEGTADDLKGLPKPMVLGKVFNVTPRQVNTDLLIYQVDGQRGLQTGWDMTVYDKRSALTRGANYANQAAMESTPPAAGQYRVHPATGCFRLNAAPAGAITVDVENPSSLGTHMAYELADDLCIMLIGGSVGAGGTTADAGVYVFEESTGVEVLNELMSCGAIGWYFSPLSSTIMAAYPLTTSSPTRTLGESQVIGEVRRVASADDDRGIPAWKVTVNYAKNYTVMTDADLAGVAAADIAFCQQEFRSVSDDDATVLDQFPRAVEITVDMLLVDAADAATEATRLLGLYSVKRDLLQVTVPVEVGLSLSTPMLPGLVVTFTYPRFGLDGGKAMQILGREIDAKAGTVTLTLWG